MLSSGWHVWPERRIVVLTKVPAPGTTKTRLGRTIGGVAAATAARAFLEDTLALAARAARVVDAALVVHTDPDAPGAEFMDLLRAHGASQAPQGPGGLGPRLRRALEAAPDAARVVLGSDAPDLPTEHVVAAFAGLLRAPVVLGPTTAADGGYHLLALAPGVSTAWLGAPIRWSTAHTLEDTARAALTAGLASRNGPAWSDVDDAAGLAALGARLALEPDARVAPRTRAWLAAGADPPRSESSR